MTKPATTDRADAQNRGQRLSDSEVFRSMDRFLLQEITRVAEHPVQPAKTVRDLHTTRRGVKPSS